MTIPILSARGIAKRYGGVQALNDVEVAVLPGTVHALVGANGAGKSTLGRILAGAVQPDAGQIMVDGAAARFRSPSDALNFGVALMQQEITLAPDMSVIDNVSLGAEPRRSTRLGRNLERQRFEELLSRTGFELPAKTLVGDLRIAQQQEVSVLWALARKARLIVMDEPTAALDRAEAAKLLKTVQQLRVAGIAVVYVSHFLEEVLDVADTVTVLSNGRHVWTRPRELLDVPTIVLAMLGNSIEKSFPTARTVADDASVALDVKGLTQKGSVFDISLDVRHGEIVGIYGLVGSGRSELAHAIAGASGPFTGTVQVEGKTLNLRSPRQAMESGVVLLPESRKDQGLFLEHTQLWNTSISSLRRFSPRGLINRASESAASKTALDDMTVHPLTLKGIVGNLSGGNQQKVLFAKCILARPKVLILDEPTRGVDIGSKRAIYDVIVQIAEAGTAVLLISSEHEEITGLSHRILVMREGRIVGSYKQREVDGHELVRSALGVSQQPARSEQVRTDGI